MLLTDVLSTPRAITYTFCSSPGLEKTHCRSQDPSAPHLPTLNYMVQPRDGLVNSSVRDGIKNHLYFWTHTGLASFPGSWGHLDLSTTHKNNSKYMGKASLILAPSGKMGRASSLQIKKRLFRKLNFKKEKVHVIIAIHGLREQPAKDDCLVGCNM